MTEKECEKLANRTDEWNVIYPFMEWLREQGVHLCKMVEKFRKKGILIYYAIGKSNETLLYEYFDIDPVKVEQERREILKNLQFLNAKPFKFEATFRATVKRKK